jgi:predicted amino acid-binding ACT domain protein
VTVYGADHPGIVHAVSSALADRRIDITDLNSRLLEEAEPVYVLMLEVALPQDGSLADLRDVLADVGDDEGVEVTLQELERDEL